MKIQKKQEEQRETYTFPEYEKGELYALLDLIKEKYNNGKTVDDILQWYVDEGGLNKEGHVILKGQIKDKDGHLVYTYPSQYAVLQDKYEKAMNLIRKKEYAMRMNTKEVSDGMSLEK